MDEETITIPYEEYLNLKNASETLSALERGGVENWEWYDESLSNLRGFTPGEEYIPYGE